jgi:chromosome segregation ATPase
VDDGGLAELRRLEELDARLAAETARLRELEAVVDEVRGRAETIDAFFAAYSDAEARRRAATAEARADLERRRSDEERATRELEAARSDEERAAASRAHARAREHVALAEARLARALEDEAELERTAASFSNEIPELEVRTRQVSAEVPDLPREPAGLRELVGWASAARAHLFVALGQLDAQRERAIREAAELGTALLAEPVYGSTPEQIRKRVEAALRP